MQPAPHADPELTGRPIDKSTERPIRRRWIAPVLGVAVVILAVGWQLAGPVQASAPAARRAPTPRAVVAAPVSAGRLTRTHRYFGVTRAAQRATLAFTVGGRLTARPVEVGDRVERGQRLATLDRKPLRHAVAAARARVSEIDAALAQARRDLTRADGLVAQKAAPAEQAEQRRAAVDALVANRRAARAQLAEARRQYAEGGLKAPFAGVVGAVGFEVGELVPAGRPVVTLIGAEGVEIEIEVPESVIHRVAPKQAVTVELPLLRGRRLAGTVARLAREASGPGRMFPVIIRLPDAAGISSGMTAIARIETHADDALLVPLAAILDPAGGDPRVFRLRPAPDAPDARPAPGSLVAERVPVEVARLDGSGLVALRGSGRDAVAPLTAGDQVIVGGHFALLDGDPVEQVEGAER